MRAKNPIVSILVPVYGVEGYIEECARSLMEQSYEECRYIFVDDASPERSIEILQSTIADYPHRAEQVTIIRHNKNQGIGATRNTLLDNSEGEFVVWVDSDDWVDSRFVESLVTRMIVSNADAVRCSRIIVEDNNRRGRICLTAWLATPQQSLRAVIGQSHLITSNIHGVMVRRELITKNKIRFAKGVDMGEDYAFVVQLLFHATRITNLHEPLYIYRTHRRGSYMDSLTKQRHVKSYIRANVWVTEFIESRSSEYKETLATAKINIKKWIALRGLKAKSYDNEIFGLRREEWIAPLHLKIYNKIVDINIIFIIRLAAAVLSLPLILRVAWHKLNIKAELRREKIWGR